MTVVHHVSCPWLPSRDPLHFPFPPASLSVSRPPCNTTVRSHIVAERLYSLLVLMCTCPISHSYPLLAISLPLHSLLLCLITSSCFHSISPLVPASPSCPAHCHFLRQLPCSSERQLFPPLRRPSCISRPPAFFSFDHWPHSKLNHSYTSWPIYSEESYAAVLMIWTLLRKSSQGLAGLGQSSSACRNSPSKLPGRRHLPALLTHR